MKNGSMSSAQNQQKHFNQLNHLHFHKSPVQKLRRKSDFAPVAVRKILGIPDNAAGIFYPAGLRKPESGGAVNHVKLKFINFLSHFTLFRRLKF